MFIYLVYAHAKKNNYYYIPRSFSMGEKLIIYLQNINNIVMDYKNRDPIAKIIQ